MNELAAVPVWSPPVGDAAPRDLCTDCGISRTADPKRCGAACQFIKPDYPALEATVHGRARDPPGPTSCFFGPFRRMLRAALSEPRPGAQWTGIATRIAERLLETGAVDAVLTMAPDPEDNWRPVPVLVTKADGHGAMPRHADGICAAAGAAGAGAGARASSASRSSASPARSMPCGRWSESWASSGSTSSARPAPTTPRRSASTSSWRCWPTQPDTITYLEFRADYHVELRFTDGRVQGDPLPAAADLQAAAGLLPADLPHLRRLHQRAGRHHRRLHGRPGRAMAAGAQRARRGTAATCWATRSAPPNPAAPASGRAR